MIQFSMLHDYCSKWNITADTYIGGHTSWDASGDSVLLLVLYKGHLKAGA